MCLGRPFFQQTVVPRSSALLRGHAAHTRCDQDGPTSGRQYAAHAFRTGTNTRHVGAGWGGRARNRRQVHRVLREDGQRGAGSVRARTEGEHEGQMGQNCATAAASLCSDLIILRYPDIPPSLSPSLLPLPLFLVTYSHVHGQYLGTQGILRREPPGASSAAWSVQ